MSRLVRLAPALTPGVGALAAGTDEETYLTRLGKYIPAEILAFYLPAMNILNDRGPTWSQELRFWVSLGCFVAGVVLTLIYFKKIAKPGDATKTQMAVSTIAFVVWAYSLGGVFKEWGIHEEGVAAILVAGWSAFAGLIAPRYPPGAPAVREPQAS